jgi:hypothetical protein
MVLINDYEVSFEDGRILVSTLGLEGKGEHLLA